MTSLDIARHPHTARFVGMRMEKYYDGK